MNTDDCPTIRTALSYLDVALLTLEPGAEPTPFVIVGGGPHGMAHVGLHSLDDDDFDYTAGTVLPALIVLNEAVEVVLVTFLTDPTICGEYPGCAAVAHWGPEGYCLSVAPVTRRCQQPPAISSSRDSTDSVAGLDAVSEGVRRGTELAHRLWDSEAEDLREEINLIRMKAATEDNDALPMAVDALRRSRSLE